METRFENSPGLKTELRNIYQTASLKLIETGAPAPSVFEAMLIVGLAGLVEVEGKLATAHRLAHIAGQLTEQVAIETKNQIVN